MTEARPKKQDTSRTQIVARVLCRSGKFECGQGCCAPICMENLGDARSKCARTVQVHGKLAAEIVVALGLL